MDNLQNIVSQLTEPAEYDGKVNDPRIHGEHISFFTDNRNDYEKYESMVNDFNIKRDKYEVYTWNDISGYDYWKDEPNYIQISVYFDDTDLSDSEIYQLDDDLLEAYDFCSEVLRECNHDLSKYYEVL